MIYYFSKHFKNDYLGNVDYFKCATCGFCSSITHTEMTDIEWEHLNTGWHTDNNNRTINPWDRDKRYFQQSLLLHLLHRNNLILNGSWLDYASGRGGLAKKLSDHFGLCLGSFDKFIQPLTYPVSKSELRKGGYSVVTNTAMFEHVRTRDELDEVASYVNDEGCLGIHTLVRGEIPADPNWMYLLPVHCSFHTNRSMAILMQQWGYTCSIYNEHAKMWVWFKGDPRKTEEKITKLNTSLGWRYLHFKTGFMDYWP